MYKLMFANKKENDDIEKASNSRTTRREREREKRNSSENDNIVSTHKNKI